MTTTDQHLNTGSMALDALPQDEAAAFSLHLETCPTCSAELTSFLETAAILGSSVAQTPPASLRRSVMRAVAATPQLPPLTAPASVTDPALGRHRHEDPIPAEEAPPVPGAQPASPPLATVTVLHRPWYRRPQALLAAAVAALVIGGGVTAVVANQSPAQNTAGAGACVTAATDNATLTPTVGRAAGGTVTLSPSCDTAVVAMPKLKNPPPGKVYQVWVIKGKNASSVKVLSSSPGTPAAAFDAPVHAGDNAIGVTLEPSPGSAAPTTAPFWVVPLTS